MTAFGENRIALQLTPAALRALRGGHPWVFDQGIQRQNGQGEAGDLAVLFDGNRRFAGIGLYDPGSPIRVRVLHHGAPQTIDADWLRAALARSIDARRALIDAPDTDGFRLAHGENDGLGGLVLDAYADTAVLKLYCRGWLPHLDLLRDLITAVWPCERLVLRLGRHLADADACSDGELLHGPAIEEPLSFLENGIRFEVDPVAGQKTGFFLDQRDNRAKVEKLSRGMRILNVFSYTGGFSLYAARGGARAVTSLDIASPALAAAKRNFALNPQLAKVPHQCLRADAFDALLALATKPQRFDLVILDPPSFARKRADISKALGAYKRSCVLGLGVLREGGTLVAASCSARVTADEFFGAVTDIAAQVGRPLQNVEHTGHALDHPVTFHEGAYLKCLFAQA